MKVLQIDLTNLRSDLSLKASQSGYEHDIYDSGLKLIYIILLNIIL